MVETNEQAVVRTVGLTKTFRDFWLREKVTAVRELDLDIRPGEVYGLLGPNGSGKSTTLKLILGLMFPTGGRVSVFGKKPTDVATKNRIGFLPEESHLYPFLDARETLDYYARLFGQGRAERKRRIDMLLDMVGLTGVSYRRIGEYSKGMQRRIGMAQALINDPDLLILDEPTSGMDPMAARQFKDLISELSRRGKTVILSSHLLADMEDVCDRVGILFAGQLRSEGALSDLLSRSNLTQITTERLDDGTAERVRELLAAQGKQVLAVETPQDKLESLFLRIVREARMQRTHTADVVNTGQVAEFLRADQHEGGRLISELVGPAEERTDEPAAQAPAPEPKPQPAKEVIVGLLAGLDVEEPAMGEPPAKEAATGKTWPKPELVETQPPAKEAATDETRPTPRPAKPSPNVDRGLIDSLIDDPKPPEDDSDA